MRASLAVMALCVVAACASPTPIRGERITVGAIQHGQDRVGWSIENGGAAEWLATGEETQFSISRADFARVRSLLAPMESHAGSVLCESPSPDLPETFVIWRRNGVETRVVFSVYCDDEDARALIARSLVAAADVVRQLARAHSGASGYALQHVAGPDTISVSYLVWGRATRAWSITRNGAGRFADEVGEHRLQVSTEAFDQILQVMSPWRRSSVRRQYRDANLNPCCSAIGTAAF